jgi:hypothetical protein
VGLHLYCITPGEVRPAAGLRGVDGSLVQVVEGGALAAWVSDLPVRPPPTLERIQQHHAVVEAAQQGDAVPLPARFDEWLEEATLRAELEARQEGYVTALASVAGTAEFGVRIGLPEVRPARDVQAADAPAAGLRTGRAYLEAAAARIALERQQVESLEPGLAAVRQAVVGLVRQEVVEEARAGVGSILHLVPRENWDAYRRRVFAVADGMPQLRFMISGPWPPYSFVR